MYAAGAAIGLFLLAKRGGTTNPPPPPPPPIVCPTEFYSSDGSKCVPNTPAQTASWSFIVDPNDVDTDSARIVHTVRIPTGFTGCIVIHCQVTNAATHEQVEYEVFQNAYTNYGGGYINRTITISFPLPATLYNVFSYVTNCTVSERYTGVVYKQVMTR